MPSSITTDGSAATGPIYVEGSPSPSVNVTSNNCGVNAGSPASPILAYDSGTSTIMYRWGSTGSSFSGLSTATHASYDLDNVGGRIASCDVDGDGTDDTVMAYQNPDSSFTFRVLLHGTATPLNWYTSGPFNLGPVGDRLIVGDFNGDGKAEPILGYNSGTSTILHRWYSTGVGAHVILRGLAQVIPQDGSSVNVSTWMSWGLSSRGGRVACWAGSWGRS